ncbi:DUF2272 domain-containing protein [Thiocystis violacea]|uniref:DUF2272 domain-containing protein n=1 Tax=Thiocystis violacea TaxID=13725 RepID=UPI001908C068|nr:DUF2272 domain-containing protein [Thiocystis violacea]MBK1721149.1 hypothetical protein [Thiocystis violacea]
MISLLSLTLLSCATPPQPGAPERTTGESWAGTRIGAPPAPNPAMKRTMIARANQEWSYFGRQTVVFKGAEESIPHVGDWEDDDVRHSGRVNSYWRAVGKPGLNGMDCQKPWSAAFISWIMQSSGVPESQFPSATAHWVYLANIVQNASLPGRYFVPRRLTDYSPQPGDLICAYRSPSRIVTINGYTTASMLRGMSGHCDLVVAKNGQALEVIGGNVRNSVSKSTLELDAQGRLQQVPRRPWFLIIQNRL